MRLSMDVPLSVVGQALTPGDVRSLADQISEGALTPLQACERVTQGGFLLTHDAELFFSELFKRGGAAVANLLLDHLSMIRIGHTSTATAKYLGNLLLDYATDQSVSHKLLAWYPNFIEVPAVLDHLSIQDEADLAFYQDYLRTLAKETNAYTAGERVSRLLMAVLQRAPDWIGQFVSALDQLQTELNLDPFLRMVAEKQVAKDVLFSQLPLIGRVAANWSRVVEWVLRAYPERRIEALGGLLEGNQLRSIALEDAFVALARELESSELPAFIQLLERHRRQEDWPKKVVIELLYNPQLNLEILVDSQRSFSLYRNIIGSLALIFDRTSDGEKRLDIKQLLNRIVDDSNFGNLDLTTYSALLYEISRRKGQGDLNPLRIHLLERIDFKHASLFHAAFFEALRGYFIEPIHAQRLLEKIVRYGKYPFAEREFLLQLLECVDQETFTNFTLRYSQGLFSSDQIAERFYLVLAQTLPERFAPVYMLNRRVFKRSFAKYSDTDKTIYKLCWPYLTFGQRFQAFLFA